MKKLLSMTLAVVMLFSMASFAFAADDVTVGYSSIFTIGEVGTADDEGKLAMPGGGTVDFANDVNADQEAKFYVGLYKEDADGNIVASYITRDDKITINVRKSTGSSAIGDVELKYGTAPVIKAVTTSTRVGYISFKTPEFFVSTKDVDFKATITFSADRKRILDTDGKSMEFVIEGTLTNASQEVYEEDTVLFVEDGPVLDAQEYNGSLEFELNDDVALLARVYSGKKYYANVSDTPSDSDVSVMDQYKDIESFMEFKTIGFGSSQVKFNYADNMYAYTLNTDGDLVYVGRTFDTLPYYNKYFISNSELAVVVSQPETPEDPTVVEPTDPVAPVETDDPEGGGDDVPPSEVNNFNPSTGR